MDHQRVKLSTQVLWATLPLAILAWIGPTVSQLIWFDAEYSGIIPLLMPLDHPGDLATRLLLTVGIVFLGFAFSRILGKLTLSENRIRKQEAWLRTTVNSIGDAVISTDVNGNIRDMNAVAEDLTGWPATQAKRQPLTSVFRIIDSRTGQTVPDPVSQVLETGRITELASHTKLVARDGTERHIADSAAPILDDDGILAGVVLVFRDVTEEYIVQQKLQDAYHDLIESESRLREAQQLAHMGNWYWDVNTGEVDWSDEVFKIFGLSPEEFTPQIDSIQALSPWPEEHERDKELIQKAINNRESGSYEQRFLLPDGSIGYYFSTFQGVYDQRGNLIAIQGTVQDITKRKQTEEALEKRLVALTQPLDDPDSVTFGDLFNIDEIQELQDHFAQATGVASLITDTDGNPITKPSNFCSLCSDIIRKSEKGSANCRKSDAVIGSDNPDGPTLQPCLSGGLLDAGAAITVGGKHIANWLIGQVRDETQTEDSIRQYAREIEADEEAVVEEFYKIPAMTKQHFGEIAEALFTLAKQLSSTAYQNVQQARFITERKNAETRLKESERKFRAVFNSTFEFIGILSPDGTVIDVNQTALSFAGIPHSEIVGKPFWDTPWFQNVPDTQHWLRRALALAANGERIREEILCTDPERNPNFVDFSLVPVHDENGNIAYLIPEGRDITERRQADEELRRLRNYLSNIIDSMPYSLVGVDAQGVVTLWNNHAQTTTGMTAEQAIGQPVEQVFPRMVDEMDQVREAMQSGQISIRHKQPYHDGAQTRYEDLTVYPLLADGLEGAVIILEDVTDRVRIEEMMVQTEKMLSVGGLAAGMAHEINNPLGGMMQAAQNIERRISLDLPANIATAQKCGVELDTVRSYLQQRDVLDFLDGIRECGARAAGIVSNMLQFSRKSSAELSHANLANLIDNSIELAAQDYDLKKKYDFRHIIIERHFDPSLPDVPVVTTEIEQVLLNLLKNGAQAMQTNPPEKPPRFTLRTISEGKMARIEVEDNGPGMPESIRRRIFEPFFTTKEVGTGTGLGLSVSYMIITQNHNGKMSVESTPGEGSKFIIHIPTRT